MEISFIKIEGLGNDYIYVDRKSFSHKRVNLAALSRKISDRRHGVGADGLIIIEKLGNDSASMEIYNSDGSKAEMCCNGLRGAVLYFNSVYKTKGKKISISTDWDNYQAEIMKTTDTAAYVRISMGAPLFESDIIGCRAKSKICLGIPIKLGKTKRILYCVAVPNPHAIIFVDNFNFDWQKEGMEIERNSIFKNKINVMFTRVDSKNRITIMPWERGAGATPACGSGAAAATVISNLLEYTRGRVTAVMPGGSLISSWDMKDNRIYQEGPTRIAFSGSYSI